MICEARIKARASYLIFKGLVGYHRWSASGVGARWKNSDAGSKLGFISITKTGSVFPVAIGHFGNSLSIVRRIGVNSENLFITVWQVRAEKKNFVWFQWSRRLNSIN